jgi:hypothetical protein
MKNYLKKISTLVIVGIAMASCSSDPIAINLPDLVLPPAAATCDNTNTTFKQLYNQTLAANSGMASQILGAKSVFEYEFNVSANKTICSVGLGGITNNNTPYTIEIFNKTTSVMDYSGSLIFNNGPINYKTITPTTLVAGNNYVIRRITTVVADQASQGLGAGNIVFPVTLNGLTITTSNLYTGAAIFGVAGKLPFIDIVFQ